MSDSYLIEKGWPLAASQRDFYTYSKDGKGNTVSTEKSAEEKTASLQPIENITQEVAGLQTPKTGIYHSLNDFRVYIFTGKGNDVGSIYEAFNQTGKITLGNSSKYKDVLKRAHKVCGFNENVAIVPDTLLFNGKIAYTTEDLDKLTKSGIFGAVRTAAQGLSDISNLIGSVGSMFDKREDKSSTANSDFINSFNTAKATYKGYNVEEFPLYINKYKNIPYYTDYNMESLTSIKFKFAFGQSRLFDSLEEVVKPIVGFISVFNMQPNGDKDFFSASGVMPTKSAALTNMYSALFKDSINEGSISVSEGMPYEAQVDAQREADKASAKNIFNALSTKFTDMVSNAAKSNDVTGLFFNIGRHIMGPYIPTSIEWNFDFSRVDENGYPCYGDITFNGLKMIDMDPNFIKSAWGLK